MTVSGGAGPNNSSETAGAVVQEPACLWAHGPSQHLTPSGLCPICAADEDDR